MKTLKTTTRVLSRAGFTLVELIAVFVIIGLLAAAIIPNVIGAIRGGQNAACQANLQKMQEGFLLYRQLYKGWPKQSGVRFFTSIVSDEAWTPSVQNTKRMNCPAVEMTALDPSLDGLPMEEWYTRANKDQIGPGWSSYAGRDQRRSPLRSMQGKGKTALVADSNNPEGNHNTTTNVLWDDLSVRALELIELKNDGTVSDDETVTFIMVGADSPVEGLQTITIDK